MKADEINERSEFRKRFLIYLKETHLKIIHNI